MGTAFHVNLLRSENVLEARTQRYRIYDGRRSAAIPLTTCLGPCAAFHDNFSLGSSLGLRATPASVLEFSQGKGVVGIIERTLGCKNIDS